jgi:hypothetical protein
MIHFMRRTPTRLNKPLIVDCSSREQFRTASSNVVDACSWDVTPRLCHPLSEENCLALTHYRVRFALITPSYTMIFDQAKLLIRLKGNVAYIWNRRRVSMGAVDAEHHMEIHDLLSLLREIGEAANLAPLKGIVGAIQLIFDKAQVRSMHNLLPCCLNYFPTEHERHLICDI